MIPEEEVEARKAPHIEVDVVLEALQTPEQFTLNIQDNFIQDFSARFQVGFKNSALIFPHFDGPNLASRK